MRLDGLLAEIAALQTEGRLTTDEHALVRHDLVLAVNRIANIAGTYGHYWSKWTRASQDRLELRPTEFDGTSRIDHIVTQGRAEDIARSVTADLCYLDPPYTKRQYAANYHLIETVARGDEPEAIGVSDLRPWRDQYSDFCSKRRIWQALKDVVAGVDCPKILISYSEDGLIPRDDLLQYLASFGAVTCEQVLFPRFRSNQSDLPQHLTEYTFLVDRDLRSSVSIKPLIELRAETKQLSLPTAQP